jgi:hypothetical protein
MFRGDRLAWGAAILKSERRTWQTSRYSSGPSRCIVRPLTGKGLSDEIAEEESDEGDRGKCDLWHQRL